MMGFFLQQMAELEIFEPLDLGEALQLPPRLGALPKNQSFFRDHSYHFLRDYNYWVGTFFIRVNCNRVRIHQPLNSTILSSLGIALGRISIIPRVRNFLSGSPISWDLLKKVVLLGTRRHPPVVLRQEVPGLSRKHLPQTEVLHELKL